MTDEANLYVVHRIDIGLQFFNSFLSFLPFGKHVIILCLKVVDNIPFL